MPHDLTLVIHSHDISQIGLGDNTDMITLASPANTVPAHLQPATITLRFEIFSNKCPLAATNLSFVANKHLMDDNDIGAAMLNAHSQIGGSGLSATVQDLPEQLYETVINRVIRKESIEFGASVTGSVFGGTYPGEDLQVQSSAAAASPATSAGYLVVSNFGGPNTNGSRYFITLRPMKEIIGSHVILGRIRTPTTNNVGVPAVGNGFERLMAFVNHPQFKVNARTYTPNNKLSIAGSMMAEVFSAPQVPELSAKDKRRERLAGKIRGREDEEEAEMLREDFEKGITSGSNVNPFANPAAFGGAAGEVSSFGAMDARVRTTKKRRVEATAPSMAPLSLAEREGLRSVAISTAQHFEGHDDDDANSDDGDDGGIFADRIRKKVFAASVTSEDLAATYRPVGVNPSQMGQSNFSVFEANALTYTSDLQDVMEQQLERQHNRERRMGRKQKALEKQKQSRLGGLGSGGAETSASATLKAALAATAAAAQAQGLGTAKANKMRSSAANVNEKLGRIREKFGNSQHSVKAFQERSKAKAGAVQRKSRY